jgi:predicted PhzF superfamily epimerase YddE/YHI9
MSHYYLLRVFCGDDGSAGNPLAVFLEGGDVPEGDRQGVAAELGLSETVFVDNAARGEMRIFTPAVELGFAGHPTVGTAWLLARERAAVETLRPPAGDVPVRYAEGMSFVAARPEWPPNYDWEQLASAEQVDALEGPPDGRDMVGAWAWLDEPSRIVRARVFPVALGIAEDEATGSAATQLGQHLGGAIDIRQGRGSRILARRLENGYVELGGRTVLDGVLEL